MAGPPLLSNVWFPPHERITATAVSTLLNYMGKRIVKSNRQLFHCFQEF